ncbi:MAG: helix-turn-helix domain-containing protein [Ruminococcus flavefaciens]|nr:helix-turn-helix domain-containing protein [Ruminococcus flavefaciens]
MVDRICRLIEEKGLSINAVEKQLGLGNGAIKRFSKNSPSIDKIISLSDFLNVSIDYLIHGNTNCMKELTSDEQELLIYFRELPFREQIKLIGKAETLAEICKGNKDSITEITG